MTDATDTTTPGDAPRDDEEPSAAGPMEAAGWLRFLGAADAAVEEIRSHIADVLRSAAAALVPSPPEPDSGADLLTTLRTQLAAPSDKDDVRALIADHDGELYRAIESALFSVQMDRDRGQRVSDQAEAVRVKRAVIDVIAAALDPPAAAEAAGDTEQGATT